MVIPLLANQHRRQILILQRCSFRQLTLEEKLEMKCLGLDSPQLLTTSGLSSRLFIEYFSKNNWNLGAPCLAADLLCQRKLRCNEEERKSMK